MTDRQSIELSQEDLAALGRIVLISTRIQMTVEQVVWVLLGVDELAGRTLTDQTPASRLAEQLERLAGRSGLELRQAEEIKEFARGARTMFKVRNENLHGVWVSLEEGKVVRLRSVLVDGKEGPQFEAEVAVAGTGKLGEVADVMEDFSLAGHTMLRRLEDA